MCLGQTNEKKFYISLKSQKYCRVFLAWNEIFWTAFIFLFILKLVQHWTMKHFSSCYGYEAFYLSIYCTIAGFSDIRMFARSLQRQGKGFIAWGNLRSTSNRQYIKYPKRICLFWPHQTETFFKVTYGCLFKSTSHNSPIFTWKNIAVDLLHSKYPQS